MKITATLVFLLAAFATNSAVSAQRQNCYSSCESIITVYPNFIRNNDEICRTSQKYFDCYVEACDFDYLPPAQLSDIDQYLTSSGVTCVMNYTAVTGGTTASTASQVKCIDRCGLTYLLKVFVSSELRSILNTYCSLTQNFIDCNELDCNYSPTSTDKNFFEQYENLLKLNCEYYYRNQACRVYSSFAAIASMVLTLVLTAFL